MRQGNGVSPISSYSSGDTIPSVCQIHNKAHPLSQPSQQNHATSPCKSDSRCQFGRGGYLWCLLQSILPKLAAVWITHILLPIKGTLAQQGSQMRRTDAEGIWILRLTGTQWCGFVIKLQGSSRNCTGTDYMPQRRTLSDSDSLPLVPRTSSCKLLPLWVSCWNIQCLLTTVLAPRQSTLAQAIWSRWHTFNKQHDLLSITSILQSEQAEHMDNCSTKNLIMLFGWCMRTSPASPKIHQLNKLMVDYSVNVLAGCKTRTDWRFNTDEDSSFPNLFGNGQPSRGVYAHNMNDIKIKQD